MSFRSLFGLFLFSLTTCSMSIAKADQPPELIGLSGCSANDCASNQPKPWHGCGDLTDDGFLSGQLGGFIGHDKLIKPTDHCFDDFVSPMINFVFFEDPRDLTEIRPIFVHHNFPDRIGTGGAVPAGGSLQLYALQFRARLTDRLSLIAVKDGFAVDQSGGALDTVIDDGWAAVTAGLKYNLVRDPEAGTLVSTGFTYEIPIGSRRLLQDVADGEFHFFVSAGQRLLDGDAHWMTNFGYRMPVDSSAQNSAVRWSNHLDLRLTEKLYVFTESSVWHYTDDAGTGLPGIAGQDLLNLTSFGVEGQTLVTHNVGIKVKPNANTEIGVAYEFPLSDFDDIIDSRFTLDLIYRF